MGFQLKNFLPSFLLKSAAIRGLEVPTSSWGTLGLSRKDTRIQYNSESGFQAYRSHELVYSCINKIADVMNDAEIIVETKDKEGNWVKKDGHLLAALFKRPNKNQTGRDVRRLMIQSEQSCGLFYGYIERSGAGIPVSIAVLNPNRLIPRYDAAEESVLFYEYLGKNGKRIPIKPEDLLIRRRSDLLDQFNGFAPLVAALKSINSDLGLTDYVDAFFEADGTPSGILKILNQTVPDTKREALRDLWRKQYSRGGSNQKGIAVLDQNAEFQRIGSNLNELAADSLSNRFEARICAVFGVPPNLVGAYVGLQHVTANATAKAELRNFWDNKISGEMASFREWLTWFVLPEFENIELIQAEKIRVGFDVSHVMFLADDTDKLHERARKNFQAGGWTLNEFREATGQTADAEGDYYVQPVNVMALSPDNRATEASKIVPAGTDPNKPVDEPTPPKVLEAVELEKKTFDLDGLTLGREPRGVETVIDIKKIDSDYQSEKEKAVKILKRFRIDLIAQAVAKLDKLTPETAHTLLLTPDPNIRKQLAKTLKNAYLTGRKQIIDELNRQNAAKGGSPIEIKDEGPLDYLEYLDELTDGMVSRIINEITTRAVNGYLQLKLLLDYSVEKLQEILDGQSEGFIDKIAGAVANAAISAGRDEELKANADAIGEYEYSAILDKNTCSPCGDADGQTASDPLDLPAAPNPDCEGGDLCRCIIVGVIA